MGNNRLNKLSGPWRITFDTNPDLCNYHCIMCDTHSLYNPSPPVKGKKIMPLKIIEGVLASAYKHLREVIPSTMGEPLLYPHFDDMVELIERYGLKLNLTTNGSFPIKGVDDWADVLLPVLSDVKISINGYTKETQERIMVGSSFLKQRENIKRFIERRNEMYGETDKRPTVTLQVTYMESNFNELEDIVKMAIEMGADRVKGHHLWVTWPELENESLRRNVNSIRRWNQLVERLHEIAGSNTNEPKIKLDNFHPIVKSTGGNIPDEWICPFLGREAWVAWDGTFNVCCAPDPERKKLGYFGNVLENDFMDLWESDEYTRLVNNWGTYEPCRKCNMRRPPEEVKCL